MPTIPPTIAVAPAVPDPSNRATFNLRSYPWTIWTRDVSPQIEAVGTNVYNNSLEAFTSATDALAYRNAAQADANTAASFSGAVPWVSGTTYTQGTVQYDPTNFLPYRRKITGAGTTAPNLDTTNYALLTTNQPLPVQDVSGVIFPVSGIHYRMTAFTSFLLPASPAIGSYMEYTNNGDVLNSGIAGNGKKIMGLLEGMFIDQINIKFGLYFTGDSFGWLVK